MQGEVHALKERGSNATQGASHSAVFVFLPTSWRIMAKLGYCPCHKFRFYVALLVVCAQVAAFCHSPITKLSSWQPVRRPHALRMAAISPPTKPPVLKGYGGR